LAVAENGAAALCTAVSLLHWWGLDPHLDEQLNTMLTDLDLHSLGSAAAAVRTPSDIVSSVMKRSHVAQSYALSFRPKGMYLCRSKGCLLQSKMQRTIRSRGVW